MSTAFHETMLLIFLAACSVCDAKDRRIPNWLAACGIWTGLVFSGSLRDAAWSLAGIAVIFLISLTGIIGGGDAKMWMAAACIGGFAFSCANTAAGCIVLIAVTALQGGRHTLKAAWGNLRGMGSGRLWAKKAGTAVPFAPYMFCGCVICCAAQTVRA